MPGQPTPPRIVEAFALNAPNCSPSAPVAGGKTAPFPATSQTGITNGAASLPDGFPPLTMTDPAGGGTPPFGVDINGILYLISAWVAYLGAGQIPGYDATLQTAMTGYAKGTRLVKASDPTQWWISIVNGNVTNPDTGGAGWISSTPLYSLEGTTTGTYANFALPGPSDYVLDFDTTSGNITLNGIVAQRDWQRVTFCNIGANQLALGVAAGTAANQIRANAGPLGILQNDALTIQYVPTLSRWVVV